MSATTTSTEKPVATEATKALKEKAQSHEKYNQLGETLQKKKGDLTSAEERLKEAKAKHVQGSQKSEEFKKAESDVKTLKDEINKLTKEWRRADPNKLLLDREEFEEHLLRRFFVIPSFEIYGGVAGLYDFGPVGCAVKANVINLWRRHFILEENMLELDMPCLTPEPVFLASGHVQRFADFMVRDSVTNECYRADKLIGEFIETELENPAASAERIEELKKVLKEIDGYDKTQLGECIKKFSIKSPAKNDVSEPFPFNLMFSTQIGPTGKFTGYLRPETAQGIFVNFKRLLDFNGGQLPFAGATVGQAFRNEIAPRSGLLRVREFTLAEIEHFMNPKTSGEVHPKFDRVKSIKLPLLSKENQLIGKPATFLTIDEAVQQGVMKNTTLAYFIGRTYQFMIAIGILPEGIRFRQHMATEMAHYASDCWDCELLTSYGWIECVGLADRSCYDLSAHATAAKTDLVAFETYKTPIIEEVLELNVLNKGKFASTLKAEKENVTKKLQALNDEEKLALQEELTKNGKISFSGFELSKDIIEFKKVQKKKTGETFVPSVIEPSFGIGRIIYCVLEHCFWKREGADEEEEKGKKTVARTVFSFPPVIAPVKCAVLPLQNNSKFDPIVQQLSDKLTYRGISNKVDTAGQSIGKRYSRQDDVGVPLIVTIDFDTLTNNTITIRERDSCTQVRAQLDEAVQSIADFVEGRTSWQQIREKYPEQAETASAKVGKK